MVLAVGPAAGSWGIWDHEMSPSLVNLIVEANSENHDTYEFNDPFNPHVVICNLTKLFHKSDLFFLFYNLGVNDLHSRAVFQDDLAGV